MTIFLIVPNFTIKNNFIIKIYSSHNFSYSLNYKREILIYLEIKANTYNNKLSIAKNCIKPCLEETQIQVKTFSMIQNLITLITVQNQFFHVIKIFEINLKFL